VASRRPSDPPSAIGLPVTTALATCPTWLEYVSIIHAMIRSLVPTSGAGTSTCGPTKLTISCM